MHAYTRTLARPPAAGPNSPLPWVEQCLDALVDKEKAAAAAATAETKSKRGNAGADHAAEDDDEDEDDPDSDDAAAAADEDGKREKRQKKKKEKNGQSAEKRALIQRRVLTGLNFYGLDFNERRGTSDFVMGWTYKDLMRAHKNPKHHWQPVMAEHFFKYTVPRKSISSPGQDGEETETEEHTVFFPTTASIGTRVELASRRQTGLSIWECGQGLDEFFDAL